VSTGTLTILILARIVGGRLTRSGEEDRVFFLVVFDNSFERRLGDQLFLSVARSTNLALFPIHNVLITGAWVGAFNAGVGAVGVEGWDGHS
jgi:hypothetical protein